MPLSIAESALREAKALDMEGIRNRSAYLMGVLRRKVEEGEQQRREQQHKQPQRKERNRSEGGEGRGGGGGGRGGGGGSGAGGSEEHDMGVAESPRKKAKSKGKATEEGKEEGKSKGKDKDKEGKKKRGAEDSPEAKPKEKEKGKRKRDVVPHVEEGAVETAARQAQPTSSLKKKRKTRQEVKVDLDP